MAPEGSPGVAAVTEVVIEAALEEEEESGE